MSRTALCYFPSLSLECAWHFSSCLVSQAGADIISVHAEAASTIHLHRTVNQIKALGCAAGVAASSVLLRWQALGELQQGLT